MTTQHNQTTPASQSGGGRSKKEGRI